MISLLNLVNKVNLSVTPLPIIVYTNPYVELALKTDFNGRLPKRLYTWLIPYLTYVASRIVTQ